jgi:hypothetical protein
MYIDTKHLPDLDNGSFRDAWEKAMLNRGTVVFTDPGVTTTTTLPGSTTDGIWSQINKINTYEPIEISVEQRITELELKNKLLELRLLVLEGVFTKEESNNIKDMLTSNDEASITLADTIIENVGL